MHCPHCGYEVNEGQLYCHVCGKRLAPQPAAEAAAGGRGRTPWEDRGQRGFFGGLTATLRESLFAPGGFFRRMRVAGGLADPLLYAMITGVVGFMLFYVWQILFQDLFHGYMPQDMRGAGGVGALGSGFGIAVLAVFIPFLVIMSLFLWAGMLHLLLMMVRGANNGFEATFRAVAYSYGAYLLMAIPFCGGLIATVWNLIIVIIGLKEAHGTSGGKASFAVLFPLLLCCVAAALFALLVLGVAAASFGTFQPLPWK